MDESSSFVYPDMQQSKHFEVLDSRSKKPIDHSVASEMKEKPSGLISEPIAKPIEAIQVCNGIYKVMIEDIHIFDKYVYTSEGQKSQLKDTSLAILLNNIARKAIFRFDAKTYDNSIAQVIMIMRLKMKTQWQQISSLQHNYYSNLSNSITQLTSTGKYDLKHSKTDNSPQRLYILDVFSLILKHNRILRSQCDAQPAGIISKKAIKMLFEIQDVQYYEEKFIRSQHWFKFTYLADFKQLLMLLTTVELKYRIYNYLKRSSTAKITFNEQVSLPFHTAQEYFNLFKTTQKEEDDIFKYNFSELICFIYGDNINTKTVFTRAQIGDKLNEVAKIANFAERKRMFLHVKAQYKISLDSLSVQYADQKARERDELKREEQKMKFDLDNAEWIHLLDNKFPRTLDITISTSSQHLYKNKFFVTLFEKSENRFKLLQAVVSAQLTLQKNVGRKIIYVSRLEYSFDQLTYNKKDSNSKTASSLTQETGIKSYITIGTDSQRVLFAAISSQEAENSDYEQVIKYYFQKEVIQHATIVLPQLSYQKTITWNNYLRLFNYFKEHHDTHVYIDSYTQHFASHRLLFSIIKSYLLDYTYLNAHYFHGAVEKVTSEIILLLGSKIITGKYEINLSEMKNPGKQETLNQKITLSQSQIAFINDVLLQIFDRQPKQFRYEVLPVSQGRKSKIYLYSKEDSLNKLVEYARNSRQMINKNACLKECLASAVYDETKRFFSKASLPEEKDEGVIIAKILEKRGMKVRQIKSILKYVTKLLLIYELTFKILRQEAVKQKIELETNYLSKVYEKEDHHIRQIFPSKGKVLERVIARSKQAYCKAISSLIQKEERSQRPTSRISDFMEQN